MIVHNLVQGSPEWLTYRKKHFNASDAPVMMGVSSYKTRSQLLHELHTGLTQEVDVATQRRFDDGHRFEALARPLAEKIIGEDLYPVVGSDGDFSASFDGLTIDESIAFEHKSLNDTLRAAMHDGCTGADLPIEYRIQMEQQLMVSCADKVLFMASKWNGDELVEERHCWYESDPELHDSILAGWVQFKKDLAAYVPPVVEVKTVAKAQEALPAVSVRVEGAIAIKDNLTAFGAALTAYVDSINKKPETDQDFADLEATVKTLKAAEDALDAAEANALAQTDSIDQMRRAVALYRETARSNRLLVEKLVKAEKENRRNALIGEAAAELVAYVNKANEEIGKDYMPVIASDFVGAVKGLKSLDSMKDKLATELARCKIEADAAQVRINLNLATLNELGKDREGLFADLRQIVIKPCEDFRALVRSRIAEEQEREEQRLEAERARIAEEECAKAQAQVATPNVNTTAQAFSVAHSGGIGVVAASKVSSVREDLNKRLDKLTTEQIERVLSFVISRFEQKAA